MLSMCISIARFIYRIATRLASTGSSNNRTVLPQELIDYTLDFLQDDVPTLRKCILVARSFVPSSRFHIYSQISLTNSNSHSASRLVQSFRQEHVGRVYTCRKLHRLLTEFPDIPSLVTTFGIFGSDPTGLCDLCDDPIILSIIPNLCFLKRIALVQLDRSTAWWSLNVNFKSCFLQVLRLPGLTTLHINNVYMSEASEFMVLFDSVALSVKNLVLDQAYTQPISSNYSLPPFQREVPILESLEICNFTSDNGFALMLKSPPFFFNLHHLRRLAVQDRTCSANGMMQALLDVTVHTLEHLLIQLDKCPGKNFKLYVCALSLTHPEASDLPLNLCRHERLASIHVVVIIWDSKILNLKSLTYPPTMRNLTVDAIFGAFRHLARRMGVPDCRTLDACIDQLHLPSLQSVRVRVHNARHHECQNWYCGELPAGLFEPGWKLEIERGQIFDSLIVT
ncbi:hypothetical protein ARMGADRAFT_1079030 [Armillaria gallica]|uniref:F-box domain-containing protein n=1 Tax=Armillaria gallica TaxID=47427 RepID=A0A2H3DSA8_ARMGA|nr:hypothetical protein ARMGADRAFT_1079030 [Armillaria gallica]